MTFKEHLLTILMEECAEIQKDTSKALRFGLNEIQKDKKLSNAERIMDELADLHAVILLCQEKGILPNYITDPKIIEEKQLRKLKYINYSIDCGTITGR